MRAFRSSVVLTAVLMSVAAGAHARAAGIDWVVIDGFSIAKTETTVGQFGRYVQATGYVTLAERSGGGEVFEAGFVKKPGWNWRTPFGGRQPAGDDEPAVHVTFDEAMAFCRWAGGRLPTDSEWVTAAYTEHRRVPVAGFERGRTYVYPLGDAPLGAQCLADCGRDAEARAINHRAFLWRGHGHARVTTTPAGVNGLHDMAGNVWEWVALSTERPGRTEEQMRGGSWWYGRAQMRADYAQSKPRTTAVVYVGFRCARGH